MSGPSRQRLMLLVLGLTALVHAKAEAKVKVVATTEHEAAIARVVGGDRIDVAYLAKGTQVPEPGGPSDRQRPRPRDGLASNRPRRMHECSDSRR